MRLPRALAILFLLLASCVEHGSTRDTLYAEVTFPPGRTSFVRTYRVAVDLDSDEASARPREPVTYTARVRLRMAELDVGARFPELELGIDDAAPGAASLRFVADDGDEEELALEIACGRTWDRCERDLDVSLERVDGLDGFVRFDFELVVSSSFRTRDEEYRETIRITEVAIP